MTHSIYDNGQHSTITVDETECENTAILIEDCNGNLISHYLKPKQLEDFIGALLHVQSKKRRKNG